MMALTRHLAIVISPRPSESVASAADCSPPLGVEAGLQGCRICTADHEHPNLCKSSPLPPPSAVLTSSGIMRLIHHSRCETGAQPKLDDWTECFNGMSAGILCMLYASGLIEMLCVCPCRLPSCFWSPSSSVASSWHQRSAVAVMSHQAF